ncbi:hypothetical protein ACFVT8_23570 [Lysinibacillus sp. NPDC058147]|uniref:hypothetical protein n=1 Tax=unclassified Lysinibacillus TaxID=2636778 RepID=UPI0036DE1ED8
MIKKIWNIAKGKIEKKEYGVVTFSSVLVVLAIPAIIHGLGFAWQHYLGGIGSIDGWLSYWGGYLGGVVGMVGVVLTTLFLISIQNKHHKDQLINQNELHNQLLESQNNQHQEQLKQQRDDIVMSINSTVQLEREKFMLQFNIEKYEKALLLLLKLDNKVDIYMQKYNEADGFISESIEFKIDSLKIVPKDQYKIYLDNIREVDDQIREMLQELKTLDKIVNSFGFEDIENSSIYQFLIVVSNNASLLNTTGRMEVKLDRRIDDLLRNTRTSIKLCEEQVHSCIEQELLKYRPIKEKEKSE